MSVPLLSLPSDRAALSGPAWLLALVTQGDGRRMALLSDQVALALTASLDVSGVALPADFQAALRRAAPRQLRLQLSAALDNADVADWEAYIAELCPDCACTRSLVFEQPPAGKAQALASLLPGLRWATQRPTDATLHALQEQGEALLLWPDIDASAHGPEGSPWPALRAAWQTNEPLSVALRRLLRSEVVRQAPRLYGDLLGSRAIAGGEQVLRWVSTLSVDLAGSTRLSGSLAPEEYARLVCRYHEACREVVTALGGSIDPPQGDDGLMCYFGFPRVLEDAAARAVLAAHELSQRLPTMGLVARIGVTSGRVAVASMQAFGLSINLAAKLQKQAPLGGVLVAGTTVELLGARVVTERVRPDVSIEGLTEPVAVYRLLHCHARVPPPRRVSAQPFVGRDAELAHLQQAWLLACEGQGQVVLVEAEAGMGKTRLLREFRWRAGLPTRRLLGIEGNERTAASAFSALGEALRVALRVPPGAAQDIVRERLTRRLRGWPVVRDGGIELLAQLLRAEGERDGLRDASWHKRCAAALLALAEHALKQGPWCVLVDDLQWLDPSSLELLEGLIERGRDWSLLLVAAQRLDQGTARRLRRLDALRLEGLKIDDSLTLLRTLCAGEPLDERRLRELAEHADGVPLYLEEGLAHARHGAAGQAAVASSPVPQRLEGLLAQQLERLQDGRALAELAAVLGREFPLALWDRMAQIQGLADTPAGQQRAVEQLLGSGLFEWRSGEPPRLRFRHALLRDAAYASLWLSQRRHLHSRVAEMLSLSFAEASWFRAEDLAEHWSLAGAPERALQVLAPVARGAAARGAHREALALCERALGWVDALEDREAMRRWALHWQLQRASSLIALDGYGAPGVEAAYLAAEAQGAGDAATRARVRLGLEACYVMRGDLARARQLAEQLVAEQPWSGDRLLALQARWALANVCVHQGDAELGMQLADDCLVHYGPELHRPSSVQNPAVMCLCYSAWTAFELGRADEALSRQQRLLALAEQLQHPFSSAVALGFAASVELFCGRFDAALAHAQAAIARCEQGGFTVWRAHALVMQGRARSRLGDSDAALADLQRGLDDWSASGAVITRATYLALLGQSLLEQGRSEAAAERLDLALTVADRHGEAYYRAELLRLRALCAWQQGDLHRAEEGLQQALRQATAQARGAYLLRTRLGLALLNPDEARYAALHACCEALPGHQHTLDAAQARAALQAWAQGTTLLYRPHCPWEPLCPEPAATHSTSAS